MKGIFLSILIALLLSISPDLTAQFSGSQLHEVQFGKLPNEEADPFASTYNRIKGRYRYKKLSFGATLANYYSQYDARNYVILSQLSAEFKNKNWEVKLGNMYETLGRGLLLRSFEIRGAVIEDLVFRSRNYFHRDVLGAAVGYRTKKFSIQLMKGEVLNNLVPPTENWRDRRTDAFNSLTLQYKLFKKHKSEFTYFNYGNDSLADNNFLSGSLDGPLSNSMSYHLEYARNLGGEARSATYASLSGFAGNFSYSLEYKRYKRFIIGAGINQPPQLIKEQTYRLLNRSTHVSNPLDEDGVQLDLFYSFENGSILNLNHALARNSFGSRQFVFRQYFAELSSQIGKKLEYKLYLDYSKDPFKLEPNRYTAGFYPQWKVSKKFSLVPEIEYQLIEREGSDDKVMNQYYSLGMTLLPKITMNVQLEITTDPFWIQTDESQRYYTGANIRYKLNQKNNFQLFVGERRGGPACNGGVCYEILDFKGMEVRWTSRF